MSSELIEKLREYADGEGSVQGYMAELMIQTADALEAKAAPVGEREAFEVWLGIRPCGAAHDLAREAFKAGAAYQRAQQPQNEYGDAYQGAREDLAIWKRRALEAEEKLRVYDSRIVGLGVLAMQSATPQPSAVPDGWRTHSVNFARAERCPQTIETLQAAWDRDQELIDDQRAEIASLKQTVNQLRQKLSAPKADPVKVQLLEALEELMYARTDKAEELATAAIAAARKGEWE